MADLPHTGQEEWEGSQASPWITQNNLNRTFDAFCARTNVLSREVSPPVSCDDGARFLIDDTATGLWVGEDGGVAIAKGADASNGWIIVPAGAIEQEGNEIYIVEDEVTIRYLDGAWVEQSTSNAAIIHTDVDDYTLLAAHEGRYIRLTSGGTKQIIIQDELVEALPTNGEWHIRNVQGGDATIVPDIYVTVNLPSEGTYVVPAGGTITLKRVAQNELDLFGQVSPA